MAGAPPLELTIEGHGLAVLQRQIKALEDGKIVQREFNKEMRAIAADLIPDARESARSKLPHGGGLNEYVANAKMRVAISSSKRAPGVKIIAKAGGGANRGSIRHPVFGHKDTWVSQPVASGWFSATMKAEAPRVRARLLEAMERVVEQIAGL